MNVVNILFACLLNFLTVANASEVLGCGGFIKSHVPIDFSKVEVKLVTKQGIVKDKTSAAPNNGYYFVPLYDKGDLVLELSPPPGWSFEPRQVALSVDGISDLCSQGTDINFVFQGFGITGKVESLGGGDGGPEGVIVHLEFNGETRTTVTDKHGNFFFTPVFPGIYTVFITHPKWAIFKKSVEVTVAESNAELPKNSLVIKGYDVKGKVKSDGEPVKNASILLFAKDKNKNLLVEGCSKEPLKDIQFKNHVLCHVTSDEVGEYVFKTLPNGQYYVVSYYQGQNIYFQPELIEFTVNHNSLELKENFVIVGFSIPGKVLRAKDIPIANAKIFLNGQEITKTDSNGTYRLEKMKAGTYKLRAESDDVIFEEVVAKINPSLQELPSLIPSAFKVCGNVTSDHCQIVTFSKVGSTKFVQTETSKDGSFCQYLSPGKYEVQVMVNSEDNRKGLQFFPTSQVIEVTSEKILNVIFSQLKTTIIGKVQCMQPKECEGLIITLKTENENEIALEVRDGSYTVGDVYPGIYEISLTSNKFCWKTDKQVINVNAAVINVPQFIQIGYVVVFISSHNTRVYYKLPSQTERLRFDISRGRSSFCVEKPGKYVFELENCHSYDNQTVMYNTDSEVNELLLIAKKHTLKLAIQAGSNFGDIQVSIKIGTEKTEKILKYNGGLYELGILLESGEIAVVIPQSEILFLSPPILSVVGSSDCDNIGVKFVAVKGKLFNGKVIPPLAGVIVTVESTDTETLVVETDNKGVFKFPPLDNKKEYKISAKKESYVLSGPDSNGNFLAHKLAEVIVEVLDDSNNKPLSGVLLSLSGGESYRRNLQSSEDGKISFHSLSPSEYFLRPMMKEYKFEPNSKIIPVQEGETIRVKLIGKRVAYSAFGQVVSLNGEPEYNMVIVAAGIENCSHYSEETTCESTGHFRIRGLQPFCSYKVDVKGSLDNKYVVERTAPESFQISNINDDVRNLKLFIFRPISKMDVVVKVYAKNVEYYKSLKVKLSAEASGSTVIHTAKVDTSSVKLTKKLNPGILLHFPSLPIDHKIYYLELESGLVQNTQLTSQMHYFHANTTFKLIEMTFNVENSVPEQPIKQTSIWSLILIFTILFVVYNIEIIANVLKDKFHFNLTSLTNLISFSNTNQKNLNDYYDNAQIDQIVQSINNVKKKPKPKRS